MKSEIKYFHSADVDNLETFLPTEIDNFGISVEMNIGPKNGQGDEIFNFVWYTPKWLTLKNRKDDIIFGRHYIISFEYNFQKLKRKLEEFVEKLEEENWDVLAEKISRIALWEFEDYIE